MDIVVLGGGIPSSKYDIILIHSVGCMAPSKMDRNNKQLDDPPVVFQKEDTLYVYIQYISIYTDGKVPFLVLLRGSTTSTSSQRPCPLQGVVGVPITEMIYPALSHPN